MKVYQQLGTSYLCAFLAQMMNILFPWGEVNYSVQLLHGNRSRVVYSYHKMTHHLLIPFQCDEVQYFARKIYDKHSIFLRKLAGLSLLLLSATCIVT